MVFSCPSPLRRVKPGLRSCARLAAATLLAAAAGTAGAQSFAVSAVVVSKSNCRFDSASLLLDFGTIDPASTSPATASVGGTVSCNGGQTENVTLAFSLGDGTYSTGPGARRMQHGTELTEFMAYGLSVAPSSTTIKKNGGAAFTVTGTILASQFQNVLAGNYSDTVQISVAP